MQPISLPEDWKRGMCSVFSSAVMTAAQIQQEPICGYVSGEYKVTRNSVCPVGLMCDPGGSKNYHRTVYHTIYQVTPALKYMVLLNEKLDFPKECTSFTEQSGDI